MFSDGGDSNHGDLAAGATGSKGRLTASAKGFCKATSTASLACGLVANSVGSKGGVSVGAGSNRTGLGVWPSDWFTVGSSSAASKTGMTSSAALWMLEPVIGLILVYTQKSARPNTTAAAVVRVRPHESLTTDLLPLPTFQRTGKPLSYAPFDTLMVTHYRHGLHLRSALH